MQRKSLPKRVIFQVHMWGGLALGLYAFLIGVTGSVLVFREEIVHRISPAPRIAETTTVSMEQIREGIQSHYPGWYSWSLEAPSEAGQPWGSYLLKPGTAGKMVFADGGGRVVGEINSDGTWLELFEHFHSFLLIPRGRLYNGIGGLALTLLALSGLVLWWPGRGEWNAAFRIVRRGSWKGVVYDLHRVGGALMLGFVVLFGLTGGYFTWPGAYRGLASTLLPTQPKQVAAPVRTAAVRMPIDEIVASALRTVPGMQLVRVLVPREGRQAVTVTLADGRTKEDRKRKTIQLTMHPHSGEVLAIEDYRKRQAGDRVVSWLGPLHTGHFGGIGVKVIWSLAGLSLPALFVTGFLMWCNRVLAPRLNVKRALKGELAGSQGD